MFPVRLEEITCTWLSDVLGAAVTAYQAETLEGAHLSSAYRLHSIAYRDNRPAPLSVVVKIAHQAKEIRDFAMAARAYVKEIKFLTELAPALPIKTPVIYGCFSDGSDTSESFIIVMEDLTVHSKVFDQV